MKTFIQPSPGIQATLTDTDEPPIILERMRNVTGAVVAVLLLASGASGQMIDCNFDNHNFCQWTQVPDYSDGTNDTANWTIHSGPTPSNHTGPPNDHTKTSPAGYYIYYEASYRQPGDTAQIQSPQFSVYGSMCLSFWYYMYGATVNTLNVYVKKYSNLGDAVFTRQRMQGQTWKQAIIHLYEKRNIQIVIEAIRGSNYTSDIAVDDIKYSNGPCGQSDSSGQFVCDDKAGTCSEEECKDGFYGVYCNLTCIINCSFSLGRQGCNKWSGDCSTCRDGYYGQFCNLTCGANCGPAPKSTTVVCDQLNAECLNCKAGFYGKRCTHHCGSNCARSDNIPNCVKSDGRCKGCIDGFCGSTCEHCKDKLCDQDTGRCKIVCKTDWFNLTCGTEDLSAESVEAGISAFPIIIGVAVPVILILVAIVIFLVIRYRHRSIRSSSAIATRPIPHNRQDEQERLNNPETHVYEEIDDTRPHSGQSDWYQRVSNTDDTQLYDDVDTRPKYRQNDKKPSSTRQTHIYDLVDMGIYEPGNTERGINLEEFCEFVLSANEDHEKYVTGFKSFKDGMVKPHTAALQNKAKNINLNVCAYDETRVTLEVWNPNSETDYINANYIHGFGKSKEYIASQGVTKDTLDDFWRMVWQTDSGKIVILTNVLDEQKDKCIEYWPGEGTKSFGSVTVTLQNTDTYANFVIRTLVLEKDQEVHRQVIQFHFTAWPDKGVPKYSSALAHFRSKVINTPTTCKGPTVVHCSTGTGRTGTYIALDYLTYKVRKSGRVDVPECVEMMRRHRVNMVETKDQYVFIHHALVETLLLSTSVVSAEKIQDTYTDLLTVDPDKGKRKIDIEFGVLRMMCPAPSQGLYTDTEEVRQKSRHSNILPIEAYTPSLNGPGQSQKDGYINAVILPSYTDPNAMIITQSPLEKTKEDYWTMVFNQNCHTIVMMNSVAELKESEIYWPQVGQTVKFGAIEVTREGSEENKGHAVLTLHVKAFNKERDIRLIQFSNWGFDMQVPGDTGQLLTAIELVQHWQRRTGNHTIVVHCMDGAEKSGLFCVLYALVLRTVNEHDVAICQVIQELRSRRRQVIPNMAQFQFCHEVVLEVVKQIDAYSTSLFLQSVASVA